MTFATLVVNCEFLPSYQPRLGRKQLLMIQRSSYKSTPSKDWNSRVQFHTSTGHWNTHIQCQWDKASEELLWDGRPKHMLYATEFQLELDWFTETQLTAQIPLLITSTSKWSCYIVSFMDSRQSLLISNFTHNYLKNFVLLIIVLHFCNLFNRGIMSTEGNSRACKLNLKLYFIFIYNRSRKTN